MNPFATNPRANPLQTPTVKIKLQPNIIIFVNPSLFSQSALSDHSLQLSQSHSIISRYSSKFCNQEASTTVPRLLNDLPPVKGTFIFFHHHCRSPTNICPTLLYPSSLTARAFHLKLKSNLPSIDSKKV